ncbi:MAG: hypothetical protein WD010_08750 [Nitriliruptor sp.]
MRTIATLAALLILAVSCARPPAPTVEPNAVAPDAEAPMDGAAAGSQLALGTPDCPPVLGADDPDPFGQGTDPALAGEWVGAASQFVEGDLADRTGGLYLDQDAGELVVIAVGPDPDATVDEVRAAVPDEHRDRVVCRHGAWTTSQLQRILEVAVGAVDGPSSGGVDTVRNRVTFALETGDPEQVRTAVADELGLDASAALVVEVPPCAEEVGEVPDGATALPGGGSTCQGMDALATGTLVGDVATGCLALGTGDLEEPLAWPRGWYVTADGVVHDHRGEPRASLGDEVALGGGFVPIEDDGGCGFDGAFLVSSLDPA